MKARIKLGLYANGKAYKRGEIVDAIECKNITPDYFEIIETAEPEKETAIKKRTAPKKSVK